MMSDIREHLVSGALSGFSSATTLQPINVLKTRVQQGDSRAERGQRVHALTIARDILRTDGAAGLWRGTVPTLFRNVPGVALYLTSLAQLRTLLAASPHFAALHAPRARSARGSALPQLSGAGNLLAGAAARAGVGLVLNPFTVLKARYESGLYRYATLWGALRGVVRGGPREVLAGFVPTVLRDAPYAGLFVFVCEGIKERADRVAGQATSEWHAAGVHALAGAGAGAVATMVTHPFDVVKTKMQVRNETHYQGVFKTFATIVQHRGIPGLFDGATMRLTRKVLSSAIGWVVYEGLLMAMEREKGRGRER